MSDPGSDTARSETAVLVGPAASLDGVVADRHGDTSPSLPAHRVRLRGESHWIEATVTVVPGRGAYELTGGDLPDTEPGGNTRPDPSSASGGPKDSRTTTRVAFVTDEPERTTGETRLAVGDGEITAVHGAVGSDSY